MNKVYTTLGTVAIGLAVASCNGRNNDKKENPPENTSVFQPLVQISKTKFEYLNNSIQFSGDDKFEAQLESSVTEKSSRIAKCTVVVNGHLTNLVSRDDGKSFEGLFHYDSAVVVSAQNLPKFTEQQEILDRICNSYVSALLERKSELQKIDEASQNHLKISQLNLGSFPQMNDLKARPHRGSHLLSGGGGDVRYFVKTGQSVDLMPFFKKFFLGEYVHPLSRGVILIYDGRLPTEAEMTIFAPECGAASLTLSSFTATSDGVVFKTKEHKMIPLANVKEECLSFYEKINQIQSRSDMFHGILLNDRVGINFAATELDPLRNPIFYWKTR